MGIVAYGMKGAAASVIMPDGSSWTGVSGIAQPGVNVSLSKDWHYGSHMMPMLTAIILQLQEVGTLTINDPIGMHIDLDSIPFVDSADGLTIKNLLNHTSNITNSYYNGSVFKDSVYSDLCRIWNKNDCLKSTYWLPSTPNPTQTIQFGGWNNFYLLGHLIEEVTGNSLDTELANRIFTPLGLSSAYTGSAGIDMTTINGAWFGTTDRGSWCRDAYLSTR